MLNRPREISAFSVRSKGFWSAVEEFGGQVDFADEQCVGLEPDLAKGNVSHLLAQRKGAMSTGIVGGNDTIASACLEFARQFGIDVPGRLALTGFDDLWLSEYTARP
jgi:DNA-binding LacI/PurR family transcriptional regulator